MNGEEALRALSAELLDLAADEPSVERDRESWTPAALQAAAYAHAQVPANHEVADPHERKLRRALEWLGDKWLLAKPIKRLEKPLW